MSSRSRVDRALHGPSLTEVTIGAAMSVALGALIGAIYLIGLPVETVREIPEDAPRHQVYLVEGNQNSAAGGQWMNKRKLLMGGGTFDVRLNEAELNAWIARSIVKPAPDDSSAMIKPKSINFRIHDGLLQIGMPCDLDLFGFFGQELVLQARGDFAPDGTHFVFEPKEFMIGSLAAHRVPGLTSLVLPRLMHTDDGPEELVAAWDRLENVRIEDDSLVLTLR